MRSRGLCAAKASTDFAEELLKDRVRRPLWRPLEPIALRSLFARQLGFDLADVARGSPRLKDSEDMLERVSRSHD